MVYQIQLPTCIHQLIFSYLTPVELFPLSLANKEAYELLVSVRLFQELRYSTNRCFKCKKERVAGVQFKDYYTKISSFCNKHTARYRICMTISLGGKNVSYTPVVTIYWPNQAQHGFSENRSI